MSGKQPTVRAEPEFSEESLIEMTIAVMCASALVAAKSRFIIPGRYPTHWRAVDSSKRPETTGHARVMTARISCHAVFFRQSNLLECVGRQKTTHHTQNK